MEGDTRLNIKTLTGNNLEIKANSADTILDVKYRIQIKQGYPCKISWGETNPN